MIPRLRLPLGNRIGDGFDEADVQRLWRRIQVRGRPTHRQWLRAPVIACAALLALVTVVAIPRLTSSTNHGPLLMTTGERPSTLLVEAAADTRRLELKDGSFIVAESRTRVDVLANAADQFLVALRYGDIRVNVHPGGARRWAIESGPVRVEVIGTEFELRRSGDDVRLSVSRGVVTVKGERVPGHVQRVSAGEKLDVLAHDERSVSEQGVTSFNGAGQDPGNPSGAATPNASAAEPPATPTTVKRRAQSLQELVERAETARRSGNRPYAILLLKQVLADARGEPQGAVAALTLARLTIAQDPAAVANALSAVLGFGVPQGLDEDVRARLVEARARTGDRAGARQAALEYQQRYPQGARLAEIQRWTAE